MIVWTYALQVFAVVFGGGAVILSAYCAMTGRLGLAGVNLALFIVNVALFVWQGNIRARL